MTDSYDKPALPHFTGNVKLDFLLAVLDNLVEYAFEQGYHELGYDPMAELRKLLGTLATADTPPEEMR